MTFKDREIQCNDCGTQFGFSAEEQSFYAQKGLDHDPRRCKQCRTVRRNTKRGGRQGQPRSSGVGLQESSRHGGGPFVRHSRHNSHGSTSRIPWIWEDREPRRAGIWQPRHGKSLPMDAPLFKASFGPSAGDRSLQGNGQERRGHRSGNSRNDRGDPKQLVLHDAICSDCSTATQVPFKPNGYSPVYCRTCLPRHKAQKPRPQRPARGRQAHHNG